MENPWGNLWRPICGLISDSGTIKIKMTHGTQDGSTASDYNTDGTGYISVGTISGTSGGCISAMHIKNFGVFPKTISGSDSTYYTDGTWFDNTKVAYGMIGVYWNCGLKVGVFACALTDEPNTTHSSTGAALSCKPLA
jgi:hypothetical protein